MTKWFALIGLLFLTACPGSGSNPPGGGDGSYSITLLFDSSVQDKYKSAFQGAATRWTQIVSGDLSDIAGPIDTSSICGTDSDSVRIPGSVAKSDDVLILVGTFTEGPGGLLGFAGPCATRQSNGLTAVGQMRFDTADLDALALQGQLNATITHEMGHVLGIGTLWENKGLVTGVSSDPNGCGTNPRYTGAKGVAAYKALGGPDATVPVEDQNGPGSCDGHWRESVFKKELMTSLLNAGNNPLSKLSIASLEDLGYSVSYNTAEAYSLSVLPDLGSQGTGTAPRTRTVLLKPSSVLNDR